MTGATRVGLIGNPLKRRHSQVMHDAAFAASGLPCRYELFELDPGDLPAFVAQVRDPRWYGFQVTAPYKRAVIELLDDVEPQARSIGAVNSVVRRSDGALSGFNTDAPGFAAAVTRELGIGLSGASVVVAGAGGAARAVVRAVLDGGASAVLVVGRRREAVDDLLAELALVSDGRAAAVHGATFADPMLADALGSADLVVNTTTVGMLDPGVPVDPALLGARTAVFDLVYVPAETELVARSRARGLPVANGAEMLVAQAEIAFERWTGIAGTAPVMRAAVAPLLADGGAP